MRRDRSSVSLNRSIQRYFYCLQQCNDEISGIVYKLDFGWLVCLCIMSIMRSPIAVGMKLGAS